MLYCLKNKHRYVLRFDGLEIDDSTKLQYFVKLADMRLVTAINSV